MSAETLHLEMQPGRSLKAKTFYPKNEEPINMIIVQSGWFTKEDGPKFHVVIEFGDSEKTEHHLLTAKEITEFGVDILADERPADVLVDKFDVLDHPNDSDLGAFVRKQSL